MDGTFGQQHWVGMKNGAIYLLDLNRAVSQSIGDELKTIENKIATGKINVVDLPVAEYGEDEAMQSAFFRRLFDDLAAIPGVEKAGGVIPMPLTGPGFVLAFSIEGEPIPKPGEGPSSNMRIVNEDYFAAMGIPLKMGRVFERSDGAEAPQVMVVNESFVERYLPGKEPLGHRLNFGPVEEPDWITIVGVVGDVHHEDLALETDPEAYWPYSQRPFVNTTLVLRTAGDPLDLAGPVRDVVRKIDPNLPVYEMRTLETLVAASVSESRFRSLLLGLFAGLALLLAAIGVYGVISYGVTQQRREIGVRMALGAARGEILRFILRGGLGLVVAGVVVGLIGAFFAGRVLESMVYDVSTRDLTTYGGVAVLIALVGLVACLVPARRATRVDPVEVLQEE
jgi:putative ABC transport system permease protein